MDKATAINKVRKLMALANCKTAPEAASAAAMAQRLIAQHRIELAQLDDPAAKTLVTFLVGEIESIADAAQKRGEIRGKSESSSFKLGAAHAVASSVRNAARLAKEEARAQARLADERAQDSRALAYSEAIRSGDAQRLIELDKQPATFALARVETALATVEAQEKDVRERVTSFMGELNLTRGRARRGASRADAFWLGQREGAKINPAGGASRLR